MYPGTDSFESTQSDCLRARKLHVKIRKFAETQGKNTRKGTVRHINISVTKVSITLNSSRDWEEWIEIIKTMVRKEQVWEYTNPDTERPLLPALEEHTP